MSKKAGMQYTAISILSTLAISVGSSFLLKTGINNLTDYIFEQIEQNYQKKYSQRVSKLKNTCPSKVAYLMERNPYDSNHYFGLKHQREDTFLINGINTVVRTISEKDSSIPPSERLSYVLIITGVDKPSETRDLYSAWVDGEGLPTLAIDEQTDKIAAQHRCKQTLEALEHRVLGF